MPEGEPLTVAGPWHRCAEWGDACAMVMCAGCARMADVHGRMPVILAPDRWQDGLTAPADAAAALCTTWREDLAGRAHGGEVGGWGGP